MASVVGERGCVYAFEPSPRTYSSLVVNLQLNPHIRNIFTYNLAVGAVNGYAVIDNPSGTSSGSAMCIPVIEGSVAGMSMIVKMLTLDTFVEEKGVNAIDLVKIDIEGFEVAALEGAVNTLTKFRPLVLIEVSESLILRAGYSVQRLQTLVDTLGYDLHSVKSSLPLSSKTFSGHEDFVGIPRERVHSL
jgi:FkbM family methyltransferase